MTSDSLFREMAEARREPNEAIPFTLDRAIDVFLNRWAFNWRGERQIIEQELRDLIAQATEER